MATATARERDTLRRWRDDVGAFSRELLGVELWPHQLEAAKASKPFRVIVKARQTGGSTLLAVVAIHTAFTRPGSTSLLLSATEDAAKRLAGEVRSLLTGSRLLAESVTEEQKARLVLSNGSRIISLPSSERQVRGYTVDGVLILDEAAFMDESLWRAALYTVAAVRNPLVYLCSTPWGGADHFFRRLWQEGQDPANPDYVSFHWDYTVSPKINRALLERERERTDPITYKAEVLGQWVDDADAYFTYDEILSAVADYPLLRPEEARAHNAVAGVDYGLRYDSNTLVLLSPLRDARHNPGRQQPVFVVPWLEEHPAGTTTYAEFVQRVASTSHQARTGGRRPGYHYLALVSEVNGVGAYPTEELARLLHAAVSEELRLGSWSWEVVVPKASTAAYKQAAYGRLKLLIQQGRLVLPRHPGLMKQLTHLRFTMLQGGTIRIEADSPAVHDDLADALAHAAAATAPFDRDRRWLAPPPRSPLKEREPEYVVTQGGTRVPLPLADHLDVFGRWAR